VKTKYLETEKDWQKSVHVEFSEKDIELEESKLLGDLKKDVMLPGFRKGKVPIKLLKSRFRDQINAEITESFSKVALEKIITSDGHEPITTPTLKDLVFNQGGPISFVVDFAVKPLVPLDKYKGLKAKKKENKIGDENIEEVLRKLQEQNAEYVDAGDRQAIFTDLVAVEELRVDADGNPFKDAKPQASSIELGSDHLPEELNEGLRGMKAGESKVITIKRKTSADKEGEAGESKESEDFHFSYMVKEIKEKKLPGLDDEFAKDLGEYESLGQLKEKIREDLEAEDERRCDSEMKESLVEKLIENNPFEVPEPLSDYYLDQMLDREKQRFKMYGGADKDFPEEEARKKLVKAAEKTARWDLLRDALKEKESLEISDEEIEEGVKKFAEMNGVAPARIKLDLEKRKSYDAFVDNLQEQKILDYLVSVSEITKG